MGFYGIYSLVGGLEHFRNGISIIPIDELILLEG